MKDYAVVVTLAEEAIILGANTDKEALSKAKQIIVEQYGESVASDATYKIGANK
jgi:hypothetical protein